MKSVSDKRKSVFVAPSRPATSTAIKPKHPTSQTLSQTTLSRTRLPQTAVKDRNSANRAKLIKQNTTILTDLDATTNQDVVLPEFEEEYRQIAYGRFLRAMLEDCLVSEKILREESEMDVQMAQLAMRFQMTVEQLDKTNKRVKEISFIAEEKRLLDLKNSDSALFNSKIDSANASSMLQDLTSKEQASLDRLETKNVDFGYNKNTGHQQLLDAVNDAITGLDEIKKHSHLDITKFKEYETTEKNLDDIGKERMDMESLRKDFEAKFPNFSERLLQDTSERIAKMIEDDDD